MKPKIKIEEVLLFIILFLSTFLLVGSFDSRLANSNGDDHPVVWSRYFSHPEQWLQDGNIIAAKAFGRASLPNLLASSLAQINDSFPMMLSWLYVFIQNVGLGLAFYLFATAFIKDKTSAVVVALLSFAMCPWQLNLAYYPSMMHSPYPGHLVMPFIVMAAYFVFNKKTQIGSFLLSIAGLIHPSQTIQFVFIAALFLLLSCSKKDRLKQISYLILPAVTSLAVPFFMVPQFKNPLTDAELLPSALLNPHLIPWENTTFWPWGFPSLVAAFTLSSFECRPFSTSSSSLKSFWWANLIALVVFGGIHLLGGKLKILPIILFCPFRVSVINSVLLAPIGFQYLLRQTVSGRWGLTWTASTLMLCLLVSKSGFFWGPLLILVAFDLANPKYKTSRKTFGFILVWWALYVFSGRPLRDILGTEVSAYFRLFMSPGYSFTLDKILVVLMGSILVAVIVTLSLKRKHKPITALLLMTAAFVLGQSYLFGQEALTGELRSVWEMQKWANRSTPRDSVFLYESGSWRGVSDRQAQTLGYRKNQILGYFRYRESKKSEEKLQSLYSQFGTTKYNELPDSAVLIFAKEYKGTHWVERSQHSKRGFPVAYENSDWRIYELPKIN